MVSVRAEVITRRTYNRPLNEEGTKFENWEETIDRVISHQRWLWERALTHNTLPNVPLHDITGDMKEWIILTEKQEDELERLRYYMVNRKISVAGRGLWLGGTWVARNREISQFNCTYVDVKSVYDMVDVFWCLLNGAGVGFRPVSGTLTGFRNYIPNIEILPSTRKDKGRAENEESWDSHTKTWTIQIGDSAEAWAKSIGKILAGKYPAKTLVLDMRQIRPGGTRLKNYGWISQGDKGLAISYEKIISIMNANVDRLLSTVDILDVVNLLGTVLSTRRSAQIAILDYDNPEWHDFATAKKDMWELGNEHRAQSNNSLVFWKKPTRDELDYFFGLINQGGNGEPGIINGEQLRARAPWAIGLNPCAEILLGDAGVCNLVTQDLAKLSGHEKSEAARLIARANYRQTCVDLRDGILQEKWHLNNDFLRLCGTSITGVIMKEGLSDHDYRMHERLLTQAAYSMAEELQTPVPKNVTTIKPEGTISKIFDTTEGMHKPLGKYIFNNVSFNTNDPLVTKLKASNYNVFSHPYDSASTLVTFPVRYDNIEFDIVDGKEVNLDSAVTQLIRYKRLMDTYCHQNVSCTISYSEDETDEIVSWLYTNWDSYVAVSFLFRNDPTKTAADLGYPYLPQEVVDKETWEVYDNRLLPVDVDSSFEEIHIDDCATGACPIR